MYEYRGSGGLVPLVLNLFPQLEVMVNYTPQLIYLCEKNSQHLLNRRMNGPQGRCGHSEEE
jgi:hypothetical protein